jgi:hypothetical protein
MANSIVEDKSIVNVPSSFVSVIQRSIEVKIPQEYPILLIINFMVFKPVDESCTGRLITRPINRG